MRGLAKAVMDGAEAAGDFAGNPGALHFACLGAAGAPGSGGGSGGGGGGKQGLAPPAHPLSSGAATPKEICKWLEERAESALSLDEEPEADPRHAESLALLWRVLRLSCLLFGRLRTTDESSPYGAPASNKQVSPRPNCRQAPANRLAVDHSVDRQQQAGRPSTREAAAKSSMEMFLVFSDWSALHYDTDSVCGCCVADTVQEGCDVVTMYRGHSQKGASGDFWHQLPARSLEQVRSWVSSPPIHKRCR